MEWHQRKTRHYISLAIYSINREDILFTHFKELFALDGKEADLTENDLKRRNAIAKLLSDWGLVKLLDKSIEEELAPMSQIKILSFQRER